MVSGVAVVVMLLLFAVGLMVDGDADFSVIISKSHFNLFTLYCLFLFLFKHVLSNYHTRREDASICNILRICITYTVVLKRQIPTAEINFIRLHNG